MFGLVDGYSSATAPPRANAVVRDLWPIKLIAQPLREGLTGTFVAPRAGLYQFALHGSGARSGQGGRGDSGPGGLAIRTVRLAMGQAVPYAVSGGYSAATSASSVSFADRAMTVTAASQGGYTVDDDGGEQPYDGAGGVASGGDINISGQTGGAVAASFGPYKGGAASGSTAFPAGVPGGPGIRTDGYDIGSWGAPGRLIVVFLGP